MMAYNAYDSNGDPLTYKLIERFVRISKTHRNIADQDKAFIEKAWKDAIFDSVENWRRYGVMTMGSMLMIFDEYHQHGILLFIYENWRETFIFTSRRKYTKR